MMPSSVVILRNEKSRQPASQCKSSILTIFIGVPFQAAKSKPINPCRRVVKDRGLFAFGEISYRIPEGPIERLVVGPEFFNRKIAAVKTAIGAEQRNGFPDDRTHYVLAAGMNEGAEPG